MAGSTDSSSKQQGSSDADRATKTEPQKVANSGGPGEGDSSATKGGGAAHGQPAKES